MIRRSSLIAIEVLLGLLAASLIGLGVAWWRLSQGPVELTFIRQHVQAELSQARSGRPVGIERVELAWSRQAGALELRAVGVTFKDGAGAVLSRSEEARIELDAAPLLLGRIALVRADFNGGEISLTRKQDGAVHVAFGPPGAAPDIIVAPPPPNETLKQRVARMLDAMAAGFRPVGLGGRLQSIGLRNARLTIVDEAGGGRWTADAASLVLSRQGAELSLAAEARLEAATGQAPASLRVTTDTAFQSAVVEFGAADVRPRALLSPAALGPFAGLDAPLTVTISMGLDRRTGVNRMEGEATLGQGIADMAGGRFSLDGGRLRGRYDIGSDELIIDQLQLAGERTRIRGEMRVRDASAILRAEPGQPAAFDVTLPALTLDVPGTFAQPIDFTDVHLAGAINAAERSINFTHLGVRAGTGALDATGRLYWAETGADRVVRPGVELEGVIAGELDVRAVMNMWPIGLGEGARAYLARALTGGKVSEARLRLDIRPADIAAGVLRQQAMDIRFSLAGGEMAFISTMSPIRAARASAVLRGNSLTMEIAEASFNNLAVSNGRIDIPRLKPKGAMATISARVEGEARNILEVLGQEPLGLGARLPVEAATASGRGLVNVRIQRPMLSNPAFAQWRFAIDGRIDNFAGAMTGRRMALANGQLRVAGDQRAIHITGPIRAGASNLDLSWTEFLNRRGRAASEYRISGDFDAGDLVRFGYPIARYAQGRIGVAVSGQGRGFNVDQANVELDLRAAAVEAPRAFWTKRAGQPASVRFDVARQPDGGFTFSDVDARGAGLVARGRVRLARDGRILEAEAPRFAVEGRSDARVSAVRAADGGLDVEIRGALFDAAPFMSFAEPPAASNAAPQSGPLRASVVVDRLKLRGGATLADARVQLTTSRGSLAMLMVEGASPGGQAFTLALGPRPSDPAGRILLRSEDAGFAVRALTGSENVVGGAASAEGDWRTGPPSSARFLVHLRDFQVVRLPAMAQLLSSAGSLTGLVETLNGDGIGFNRLDAEMAFANGRLSFSEGRMAGPALGLTGHGAYNIARDNLDVDGVVAPSYGLNSLLGVVPIVGDLFVSRRGEGVLGMTYSINGPAGNPRVGVNPLSALTPGILRRIFDVGPRREPVAEALPAEPEAPAPAAPSSANENAAPGEVAALPATAP